MPLKVLIVEDDLAEACLLDCLRSVWAGSALCLSVIQRRRSGTSGNTCGDGGLLAIVSSNPQPIRWPSLTCQGSRSPRLVLILWWRPSLRPFGPRVIHGQRGLMTAVRVLTVGAAFVSAIPTLTSVMPRHVLPGRRFQAG